ncbi:MAG: PaaI family thioesterase [Parvibaculales bacterium]
MTERDARQYDLINARLEDMPFAAHVKIELVGLENGVTLRLEADETVFGNSEIRAMHGGCMAGLLETAAVLEAARHMTERKTLDVADIPVPLNTTTQYLRGGKAVPTYARAEMLKHGRRSSTLVCRLWQESEEVPLASMTAIMMTPSLKKA